jgi:hypothetical protein
MSTARYEDSNEANAAGLDVTDDGQGCFELSLLSFEGVPLHCTITVPKRTSVRAVQRFFRTLQENEDIYIALLKDHIAENPLPVSPPVSPPLLLPTPGPKKIISGGTLKKQLRRSE